MSSRVKQKQANRFVREQLAKERRRRRTLIVSVVAVIGVIAAGLIGFTVYQLQKPSGGYSTPAHASTDHTGIVVSSGKTGVDVYLDFLCPNCKKFEDAASSTLDQLSKDGKVQLVYHPIAILDASTEPSGYSTRAGNAAACAADANKFTEYARALYAQQPAEGSGGLTDDQLVQIGSGVGLSGSTFEQCVRGAKYSGWVAHNTEAAAAKNINGTPTVLVNGKQVSSSVDAIKTAVDGS